MPPPQTFLLNSIKPPYLGRKAVPIRLTLDLSAGKERVSDEPELASVPAVISAVDLQKKADRILESKYAPPAVVVDADLQIVQLKATPILTWILRRVKPA